MDQSKIPCDNPTMSEPIDQPLSRVYIDTVKRIVTNYAYLGLDGSLEDFNALRHYDVSRSRWNVDPISRPLTLLTNDQLDLIQNIVIDLDVRGVPGDYIEAGIWRGGVIVFLRALLKAHGIPNRKVFGADSFAGIPRNALFRHDPVDNWADRWVASLGEVTMNIARMGFLDDQTVLVPGYFADSLPALETECFSLIRLDCDAFDSVAESLNYLYPRLSQGGIVIIDDWHLVPCQLAVGLYRDHHGIDATIKVQAGNAYWIKQQELGEPGPESANHDWLARAKK